MLFIFFFCQVVLGSDVLLNEHQSQLEGKRIGLIANHTALQSNGTHLLDALLNQGHQITTIFSPEHGFLGIKDEYVADGEHGGSQIPIKSLYGKDRKPKLEDLENVDVLVFDIQDIGVRFYTYVSTLALCMQAASESGVSFVVCDRPNPLGGLLVDGPVQDPEKEEAFISFLPMSIIHGMTMGELAKFIQLHYSLKLDLKVIPMRGWKREMTWDLCGLPWVNPSPNMRSFEEIMLYPMVALFEGIPGVSVGRGTDRPFEYFAWANPQSKAIGPLNQASCGVWVMAYSFDVKPGTYPFAGQTVQGLRFVVNQRREFDPILGGMTMIRSFSSELRDDKNQDIFLKWWGNQSSLDQILQGDVLSTVRQKFRSEARFQSFLEKRTKVLIY